MTLGSRNFTVLNIDTGQVDVTVSLKSTTDAYTSPWYGTVDGIEVPLTLFKHILDNLDNIEDDYINGYISDFNIKFGRISIIPHNGVVAVKFDTQIFNSSQFSDLLLACDDAGFAIAEEHNASIEA